MLVLKRVGNVQCITQKLRKVMRSREQVKLADDRLSSPHTDTIIKVIRRAKRTEWSKSKTDNELSQLHEIRERLLFRTVPVSLSLLERELHSLSLQHPLKHTHVLEESQNVRGIYFPKSIATSTELPEIQEKQNTSTFCPSKFETFSEQLDENDSKRKCYEDNGSNSQCEPSKSMSQLSLQQNIFPQSPAMQKINNSKNEEIKSQERCIDDTCQGQEEKRQKQLRQFKDLCSNEELNKFALVQHVVAQRLLSSLLYLEQERRVLLKERQWKQTKECDKHNRHLQHVQRQLRTVKQRAQKSISRFSGRSKMSNKQEQNELQTQIELLEKKVITARSQLSEAKTTMQLLESSLIARPYLSAKMWQFLLRKEVWAPLLKTSCNPQTVNKLDNDIESSTSAIDVASSACEVQSLSLNSKFSSTMQKKQINQTTQLIKMCFALSHIVLGVLSDYIRGGELNSMSPRFVVSFPSQRFIKRHLQQMSQNNVRKDHKDREMEEHKATCSGNKECENNKSSINNCNVVSNDTFSGTNNDNDDTIVNTNNGSDANDLLFDMLQRAHMVETDVKVESKSAMASSNRNNNNHLENNKKTQESLQAMQSIKPNKHRKITKRKRISKKSNSVLSWLPSHSANVLPLVVHTLALHSFLLSELEVDTEGAIRNLPLLLNTLVTLQKSATITLTLLKDNSGLPMTNNNNNNNKDNNYNESLHSAVVTPMQNKLATKMEMAQISFSSLHSVLHKLEDALTKMGKKVKTQLHSELVCGNAERGAALGVHALQISPQAAAEIILELHSLHLLSLRSRNSSELLDALLVCIFPQLRSNTENALTERTRKTGLLAFATQRHRRSLMYKLHNRSEAEDYLHNTTIQQARLRQRAMMAALRERYLTEIHLRTTMNVGKLLPSADLLTLLEIIITRACETEASKSMTRSVMERNMAAVIFTSEALLLSMVLNEYIAEQTKEKKINSVTDTINSTVAKRTYVDVAASDQLTCDVVSKHHEESVELDYDKTNNNVATATTKGESEMSVAHENDDQESEWQSNYGKLRKVQPISLELLIRLWRALVRLWPIAEARHETKVEIIKRDTKTNTLSALAHAQIELMCVKEVIHIVLVSINATLANYTSVIEKMHIPINTTISATFNGSNYTDSQMNRNAPVELSFTTKKFTKELSSVATSNTRESSKYINRASVNCPYSLSDIVQLADSVTIWMSTYGQSSEEYQREGQYHRTRRLHSVNCEVQTTATLLLALVEHDHTLWNMIRSCKSKMGQQQQQQQQQQQVIQCLTECFHTCNLLTRTTEKSLAYILQSCKEEESRNIEDILLILV